MIQYVVAKVRFVEFLQFNVDLYHPEELLQINYISRRYTPSVLNDGSRKPFGKATLTEWTSTYASSIDRTLHFNQGVIQSTDPLVFRAKDSLTFQQFYSVTVVTADSLCFFSAKYNSATAALQSDGTFALVTRSPSSPKSDRNCTQPYGYLTGEIVDCNANSLKIIHFLWGRG